MLEAVVGANVLLRFLTDEPPELEGRAPSILEQDRIRRIDLVVTSPATADVVYVLESVHG